MEHSLVGRVVVAVLIWSAVTLVAGPVVAQSAQHPRGVLIADVGYARTWDDEGLLGSGACLLIGGGYRITDRLTLQAFAERVAYDRDIEYLAFDGRVLFVGGEVAFQSARPSVRPFVTFGAGLMNDEGTWTQKTSSGPGQPRVEQRVARSYSLAMTTASTGLDVRVTDRLSVRAGARWHGLLDTGDDLAPHSIIQFTVGTAWYW